MADDRPDLAAMVARLGRTLVAAERPILAAHDVSMWGYVVLTALADEPMRTQAALARAIGADKTRIIADLDELQERGLIEREPDPADRRVRLLRLTPAGRRVHTAVRRAIRAEEERLLADLPAADRRVFLRVLQRLDQGPL
ncbi:MarR family transcriptional regulator [Actinoplanes sp. NPDC049316]|uniref:MarR family winged helix-turn-helix transcriptional regulator n=1 Tax=Actinoplanes sp. NPDC049316 TaxID=3154727 RepID=UPI0034423314